MSGSIAYLKSQIGKIGVNQPEYIQHILQGDFLTGPAQKSSKYGTGPPQQEKMTKYTGPAQDAKTTIFFQHCRPNYSFKYAIYCSNNSSTHSNASPSLVFHLENFSDNHGLLVDVEIVETAESTFNFYEQKLFVKNSVFFCVLGRTSVL